MRPFSAACAEMGVMGSSRARPFLPHTLGPPPPPHVESSGAFLKMKRGGRGQGAGGAPPHALHVRGPWQSQACPPRPRPRPRLLRAPPDSQYPSRPGRLRAALRGLKLNLQILGIPVPLIIVKIKAKLPM